MFSQRGAFALVATLGLVLGLSTCGGSSRIDACSQRLRIGPTNQQLLAGASFTITTTGGTGPYSYSIDSGDGSVSSGGVVTAGSSTGTLVVRARDSSQCGDNTTTLNVTVRPPTAKVYFEIDPDSPGNNIVYGATFDYTTNAMTTLGSASSNAAGINMRLFHILSNGNLISGFLNHVADLTNLDTFTSAGSVTLASGRLQANNSLHAGCQLENGNLVVGDYRSTSQGQMWEFGIDGSDTGRQVYTSTQTSNGGLSYCKETQDGSLLLMDVAYNLGLGGELVLVPKVGDNWNPDGATRSGSFKNFGGATNNNVWSMLLHTDGYVYTSAFLRNSGQHNRLIRCPLSNLNITACESVGNVMPDVSICAPLRPMRTQSIAQIPGTNDMLMTFSTASAAACRTARVYRYSYANGTYTHIASFRNTTAADGAMTTVFSVTNFDVLRQVEIK